MDPELHDKSVLDAYSKAKELGVEMLFVGSVFLGEETKQKSSAREQISELSKPWVQNTCLAPWSEAVIGYDGNVRVCCYHNEYDEGIGSLRKSTFRDIWNSQKAIDIREQFKKQGFCSHCVKPNSCRYMGRI
jgi:radical SAM protein with 4Fe4S-binding SPASM domain